MLCTLGDDATGKQTLSFRRLLGRFLVFSHQFQELHRSVVVVQNLALGRLVDERIEDRLELPGGTLDQVPLGRGRQRDPEVALELLQAVEREARPAL